MKKAVNSQLFSLYASLKLLTVATTSETSSEQVMLTNFASPKEKNAAKY